MSKPWLWVTVNGDRALVTGRDARQACLRIADDPRWSASGRGWVIPSGRVEDLRCLAWTQHEFVAVRQL